MSKKIGLILTVLSLVAVMVFFVAGKGGSDVSKIELNGAGASFPAPLYEKMLYGYNQETGAKVTYNAIGSSGGIRSIKDKVVDFGGTDAYVKDGDMSQFDSDILHIPTCLGAIVVTYNLPGSPELRLDGDTISNIFLGNITKWNDSKIQKLNPNVKLPSTDITVAHRSDGSGTSYNFTAYLSKVSSQWNNKVGAGKTVNWPVGVGGPKNAGVAALVKQTVGAIGYVELSYAINSNLPYATVKNSSGNFIKPSLESTSLAADTKLPEDTRIELVNTGAADGYPISTFTWIVVYKEQNYNGRSKERAEALVKLLWWMTHEGQKYAPTLEYAPLSDGAKAKVEKILKSITFDGQPIM